MDLVPSPVRPVATKEARHGHSPDPHLAVTLAVAGTTWATAAAAAVAPEWTTTPAT